MSADFDYDVVIIGGGLGGCGVLYALRDAGLRILVLERGSYLKQEPQNWDPDEVISRHRYDPTEEWMDQDGRDENDHECAHVDISFEFKPGAASTTTYRH